MQRDLSMPQCISLTLERWGFWIPAGVGRSGKFGRVDLIEAKAKLKLKNEILTLCS